MLLAILGVMQDDGRIGVGLPAGIPDLADQDIAVGADRAGHIRRRLHHMDGEHPVVGARHIIAVAAGDADLLNGFPQRHADGKIAGVGIQVAADAVGEIQVQVVSLLYKGDRAVGILDAEIIGAEIQQPADVQPQIAAVGRGIVHHQRGIVQNPRGAGRHRRAVQVGGAVRVGHMGRGRIVQLRRVVRRVGPAAQRKAEIDRGRIAHPQLQRVAALLQLLQLGRGVFLPVDRHRDGLDVLHQVDLPMGRRVIVGVVIVVGRILRVGRRRPQGAQKPEKSRQQAPAQRARYPFCSLHRIPLHILPATAIPHPCRPAEASAKTA